MSASVCCPQPMVKGGDVISDYSVFVRRFLSKNLSEKRIFSEFGLVAKFHLGYFPSKGNNWLPKTEPLTKIDPSGAFRPDQRARQQKELC